MMLKIFLSGRFSTQKYFKVSLILVFKEIKFYLRILIFKYI
jgi:hypothetical protein